MSYRYVPRKAIRYTEATRPDKDTAPVRQQPSLSDLTYRQLQQKAVELGISGKQTADALREQITEAENA